MAKGTVVELWGQYHLFWESVSDSMAQGLLKVEEILKVLARMGMWVPSSFSKMVSYVGIFSCVYSPLKRHSL